MDSITHAPEIDLPTSLNEVDAYCVYAAFEKITDGRCKRGIRYPVALILTLIVLARVDGRAETEWSLAVGAAARDVAQRSIAPATDEVACRLDVYRCAGALG
jgi:hypothetical protein